MSNPTNDIKVSSMKIFIDHSPNSSKLPIPNVVRINPKRGKQHGDVIAVINSPTDPIF